MGRTVRSLLLCLILLVSMLTPAYAEGTINEQDAPAAERISVNAYSAILLDMDTEQVLYEYNADEINYPASTTKMMTALLCLENGNPDDVITVSYSALDAVPSTASLGGLVVGEQMTIHQVLQLMLVVSASEATTVIAEYVAGDIPTFVDMMNERAQELGCTNTHFVNTHGFPNPDHYTTARDLSKIALAAMEYQEFRDIVGAAITVVEPTNVHGTQTIVSTNGILPGSRYTEYNYPYAIGIKTGHTSYAGYCLVSAADKDGLRLLCVVMGTPSRTSSFAQTISLFEWGYDNFEIINYGKTPEAPDIPDMTDVEEDSVFEEEETWEIEALEESEPTATPTITPAPTPTPEETVTPAPSPTAETLPATVASIPRDILTAIAAFAAAFVLLIVLIVLLVKRKK